MIASLAVNVFHKFKPYFKFNFVSIPIEPIDGELSLPIVTFDFVFRVFFSFLFF